MPDRGRVIVTLLLSVILLAVALEGGYLWLQHAYNAPGPSKDIVRVQVEQGESVRSVLLDLTKQGALDHPHAVEFYLRIQQHLTGHPPRIQIGMYEIPAGSSPA